MSLAAWLDSVMPRQVIKKALQTALNHTLADTPDC
jgi:hypothetical protein